MPFTKPQGNIKHLSLEPGQRVADLGVGAGHYAFAAADAVGGGGKVIAIDVQKKLVEKVKKEAIGRGYGNIEVIWGDIEEKKGTTLADASVHVVLLTNILFQVEDKAAVLAETARILRPRGKTLVIDWSDSHGGLGPQPGHVVSKEEAQKLCEDVGLVVEKDVPVGDHHYGFIARKQ